MTAAAAGRIPVARCIPTVLVALGAVAAAQANAQTDAAARAWNIGATTGAIFSTGKYGTDTSTDVWVVPLVFKAEKDRFTSSLVIPYLISKGPAVVREIGAVVPTPARQVRVEGFGDVTASVGYDWYVNEEPFESLGTAVKVKFPTGSEDKGLGTGKFDYMAEMNGTKVIGNVALLGTVGYRIYGDLPTVELRNVFYGSATVFYNLGPLDHVGLSYDTRQKLTAQSKVPHDLTLYFSHKVAPYAQVLLLVGKGFGDASQDWGGGLMLVQRF